MAYYVYIIYSTSLGKYYVGSTENFEKRFQQHNAGWGRYTKTGIPWKKIKIIDVENRSLALKLELKIKKRGIKRYLEGGG